ncbi:Protein of unknown function [Pyronema omphalodes CBS 100304]|uniref:Uncharacterized protein n=1 Tax=Pyronema omphalodes (strain CBS 100304) TaxID=1076935 RepID=U4LT44_PYROM|nr:Protein of unknown function [Pyronema omphalodes CBS 100304]
MLDIACEGAVAGREFFFRGLIRSLEGLMVCLGDFTRSEIWNFDGLVCV